MMNCCRGFVTLCALSAALLSFPTLCNSQTFAALLDGTSEAPPNASPGTGFSLVTFDIVAHSMTVDVTFSGLLGTTTASHIHAATAVPGTGTAGVATQVPTFISFPLGVTSGTYNHTFDTSLLSTYNPAFVASSGGTAAGAEAALLAALNGGNAYLNIHTTFRPGGEIRGFLQAVPEPGAAGILAGIAIPVGLQVVRRYRRRTT